MPDATRGLSVTDRSMVELARDPKNRRGTRVLALVLRPVAASQAAAQTPWADRAVHGSRLRALVMVEQDYRSVWQETLR
jgi:hypothetical protein